MRAIALLYYSVTQTCRLYRHPRWVEVWRADLLSWLRSNSFFVGRLCKGQVSDNERALCAMRLFSLVINTPDYQTSETTSGSLIWEIFSSALQILQQPEAHDCSSLGSFTKRQSIKTAGSADMLNIGFTLRNLTQKPSPSA